MWIAFFILYIRLLHLFFVGYKLVGMNNFAFCLSFIENIDEH